jgi:hypothetical protein
MSLKYIMQGYTNLIFQSKSVEEKKSLKREICNVCPHGVNGILCKSKAETISEVSGQIITVHGGCGCPLIGLLRSDKPCPKGNF